MSMYGLRIGRMMETMRSPQTDSKRQQLSNSPTDRDAYNDNVGTRTTIKHERTHSTLEKYKIDTKMNSVYKKRISNSKRYLDNSTKLDAKLIFRDDQRHIGDLNEKMLNCALLEKKKGDTLAVN